MTPAEKPQERTETPPDAASPGQMQVSLALDRTTLAWIRTALTFATFGFGMVAFFRGVVQVNPTAQSVRLHQAAIQSGVGLIIIGIVATILAAVAHWLALRRLRHGEPLALAQWPLAILIAMLVAVLGLYALWSAITP